MNKNITLLAALFISATAFSQVGINTENPQGIFNIDGAKDNPNTGNAHTAAQQLNDFTVLSSGNVGIGTISPSQKLEIQTGGTSVAPVTGFKLVDGTQNNNYVLTADAAGVGQWKPVAITTIAGEFVQNGAGNITFGQLTGNNWISTGATITLPPGKWKVDVTQLLRVTDGSVLTSDDYMWFRFTFVEGNVAQGTAINNYNAASLADLYTNARVVSGNVNGPKSSGGATRYGFAQGFVFIRNSTAANKTYTLIAGSSTASSTSSSKAIDNVGGKQWSENAIFAMSVTD